MPSSPRSLSVSPTASVRSMTSPSVLNPSPSGVASITRPPRSATRSEELWGRWAMATGLSASIPVSRRAMATSARAPACTGRVVAGCAGSRRPLHAPTNDDRRDQASEPRRRRPSRLGPELADQPLLDDRRHEQAVLGEHEPTAEAPATRGGRGVLGVQQPLVGPERAVEPHRMVEADAMKTPPAANDRAWGRSDVSSRVMSEA